MSFLGKGSGGMWGDNSGGFGNLFDSIAQPFEGGGQALDQSNWAAKVGTPFADSRPIYEQMLMSFMKDPKSFTSTDPGFKFGLDTGTEAVARKMGSEGFAGSGNEAIELQKFGEGFAFNYMNQFEQLLAGLAGANINPNPQPSINAQKNANDESQNNPLGFGSGGSMGGILGMFM